MSPDLLSLLEQRKQALMDTRRAALGRAEQLDKRIKEMQNLVKAAVPSAQARVVEAENNVREAYQKVEAARIAVATAELNVDRHKQLAEQGLVSQRELEVTIQAAIASKAELNGAQAHLKAAEQGMKALSFGREQVSAEVLQRLLDAEAARDASVAEAAKAIDQLADVSLRMIDSQLTLFEGTIEDNIVLGRSYIPYSDVRWALRFAELEEDVDTLSEGLKTHIRAPGKILTPMHIIRILLARAVLARPQVLVFDGILHSLQPVLRETLLRRLCSKDEPWSVIFVSNDPNLTPHIDRRLILE